jgi:magnesium transporter
MVNILAEKVNFGFEWIDVVNTTREELQQVAEQHGLHPASVADALQPEHLPKYEKIGEAAFIITRFWAPDDDKESDTIQELTNKIAIFYTRDKVITIHRDPIALIDQLKANLIDSHQCRGTFHLLNRLIKAVLFTFDEPARQLSKEIEFYETQVFFTDKTPRILKGMYHLRRKVDVTKRLLLLSKEILEHIDDPARPNPDTRDTLDLFIRLTTFYDTMFENTNQLLNIYFSLSSHRVNEVIRVLTIFSVFFLPLTFIAGIYGMNFEFMPELHWKWGYPGVMIFMGLVTLGIFFWFKKKGWL